MLHALTLHVIYRAALRCLRGGGGKLAGREYSPGGKGAGGKGGRGGGAKGGGGGGKGGRGGGKSKSGRPSGGGKKR